MSYLYLNASRANGRPGPEELQEEQLQPSPSGEAQQNLDVSVETLRMVLPPKQKVSSDPRTTPRKSNLSRKSLSPSQTAREEVSNPGAFAQEGIAGDLERGDPIPPPVSTSSPNHHLIEAELVSGNHEQPINEEELQCIKEKAIQEAQENLMRNAVKADVVDGEEGDAMDSKRRRRYYCLAVFAMILILGIVAGVVIGTTGGNAHRDASTVPASTFSPCGSGDVDTEPPTVESFNISPNALVLSDEGSREVTITVRATDNLSGILNDNNETAVWMMFVELRSRSDDQVGSIASPLKMTSNSNVCEAEVTATATISAVPGSWDAAIKIVDGAGNELIQEYPNALAVDVCSIQPRPVLQSLGDGSQNDRFGDYTSLSGDGSVLAIGAQVDDYVQVHHYMDGKWTQMGDTFFGDESPNALSDDGTILVIASEYDETIFTYSWGGSSWVLVDTITEQVSIGTALELSADGKVLAASSPWANDSIGEVRVYDFVNGAWVQRGGTLTGRGEMHDFGDKLGLSEDGNIVAVGIHGAYSFDTVGFVEVYEFVGGDWVQKGQMLEGTGEGNLFGRDVSLSSDGRTLAVGQSQSGSHDKPNSGAVHIYRYDESESQWLQFGSTIFGEAGTEYLGRTLALSGDANILVVRGTRLMRFFHLEGDEYVKFGEKESSSDYRNAASISRDGSTAASGASVFDITCTATNM